MPENVKHVLITAAAKNTGLGIARRFLGEGWAVHITSRNRCEIEKAGELLRREYPEREIFTDTLDLTQPDDIRRAFANLRSCCPRLNAFVQNAANLGMGQSMFEVTPEDFDAVLLTNVRGTFFACREAASLMRETGGGSIVTLGSITYRCCVRNRVTYITSKGAIAAMTRAMALDCSPYGIRVNCVLPGMISTDRWDRYPEAEKEKRRSIYPLRESNFADVAQAVYFLASEQSANITGIELVVDGGTSLLAVTEALR